MSKTIKPFQRAHRAAGLHSAMAASAGVLMNRTASEVRRSRLHAWCSVALITPEKCTTCGAACTRVTPSGVASCTASTALTAVCANAMLLTSVHCRRAPLLRAWEQQRAWERRCWATTPPRRQRRPRAPAPTWRRWRRAGRVARTPQSSRSANPYSSCCGRRRGRPSTCWRRAAAPSSGPSASRRARRAACARAACLRGGVCATAAKQIRAPGTHRPKGLAAHQHRLWLGQSCGGPSTASAGGS
jgi:hypothetical protein